MKILHKIAFILVIIGGLNWLLIGLLNWGIGMVLGVMLSKIIYILVGVSALYLLFPHKDCCGCEIKSTTPPTPVTPTT